MSGLIVLLYKGGEHATGAPDCFTFFRDRTRELRRPGFGTAWHMSELGEGCNTCTHPVSWTHVCATRHGVARIARALRVACDTPAFRGASTGCRVLLQRLGSRVRVRWVDLATRPIRTPCGSGASDRPRRPSPSTAPAPCGAHALSRVRPAVVNRLNPSIGRVRRLMNRWSCSMTLFRYLHWRRDERGRKNPSCLMASNAIG